MANDCRTGSDVGDLVRNPNPEGYKIPIGQSDDDATMSMSEPREVGLDTERQKYLDRIRPILMRYTETLKGEILASLDGEMRSASEFLVAKRAVNNYRMGGEQLDKLILEGDPLSSSRETARRG
jgi:hypothetical protein